MKNSFDERVLACQKVLYKKAIFLTKDSEEAKDLVQETFYKAFKNKEKYLNDDYLNAWLIRILNNTYIDKYRKKKKRNDIPLDDTIPMFFLDKEKNLGEFILEEESIEKFIINSLSHSPKLYKLFNLSKDHSYQEMADIMQSPMGTVKASLYKARRILEKKLKIGGYEKYINYN